MIAPQTVEQAYNQDFTAANNLVLKIYSTDFLPHFSILESLYYEMSKDKNKISDASLEEILVNLPLELFKVSEKLTELRVKLAVTKLKNRETKVEKEGELMTTYYDLPKSEMRSRISAVLPMEMASYELLVDVYEALIDLVSSKLTFSKELIMSAKKVWTSRREAEGSMPCGETTPSDSDRIPNLPVYNFGKKGATKV